MVGAHFESLFPTLATFGRNKQMAWMMWHSTADVKLPDIERVLEGVPADLAHVIQRLIAKDQSQRYRSAHEALRDLQAGRAVVNSLPDAVDPEAEAEAAAAERRKKRFRNLSILAGSGVLVLCLLIMMIVLSHPKKRPPAPRRRTHQGVRRQGLGGIERTRRGAVRWRRGQAHRRQGAGYHLCERRAALARGFGGEGRRGNHPHRRPEHRTRWFKRSMPRGPAGLPPAGFDPGTMRPEPSSWRRATRPITRT